MEKSHLYNKSLGTSHFFAKLTAVIAGIAPIVFVAVSTFGLALLLSLASCSSSSEQTYEIPAPPSFVASAIETPIINNLHASGLNPDLLTNPDRGFRGEVYITLGSGKAYPSSNNEACEYLQQELALFAPEQIQILQCYVYLSEFKGQDLTPEAFAQLTAYFQALREQNIRILLRFAYDYSANVKAAASTKQTIRHLEQIGEWIARESKLFNSTVYAVQLGLVGLWGEGHGSTRRLDEEAIFAKLAEVIPLSVHLQARLPEFFSMIPEEHKQRLSVHDDFLVGIDHEWGMIPFTHPQYQELLDRNNYALSDGEMPWGRDTTVPTINPELLLKQVVGYNLTTLSAKHNYKEDGNSYFLEQAKDYWLTEEFLQEQGYPYNPFMLVDDEATGDSAEAGETQGKISLFDYLQYHLGYNLVASNFAVGASGSSGADEGARNSVTSGAGGGVRNNGFAEADTDAGNSGNAETTTSTGEGLGAGVGSTATAEFIITNFGLAAPHEFILELRVNNQLIPQPSYHPLHLMKFGQFTVTFPYTPGDLVTIRLVHRRAPSLFVRLANNLPYDIATGEHIIAGNLAGHAPQEIGSPQEVDSPLEGALQDGSAQKSQGSAP